MRTSGVPRKWLPISLLLALLVPGGPAARAGEEFSGIVSRIPPHVAEDMVGNSWHLGCPVPIRSLRLLTVSHWGDDGDVHTGRLLIRNGQADEVLWVMSILFNRGFPIKQMQRIDRYGGNDRRSMNHNNTSAFNCRTVTGPSDAWSRHAYGTAIDINPVQNPYVSSSGQVLPKRGRPFVDRTGDHAGMIHAGDAVVQAFSEIGWEWGGSWSSPKDYMHFSLSGG